MAGSPKSTGRQGARKIATAVLADPTPDVAPSFVPPAPIAAAPMVTIPAIDPAPAIETPSIETAAVETPVEAVQTIVETGLAQAEEIGHAAAEQLSAGADLVVEQAEEISNEIERSVDAAAAPTTQRVHDIASKGSHLMATAFDTGKAQAVFGDINARAKGALEKGTKFAEDLGEFHKGNVEAVMASGRVAAKGIESLAQDAAEQTRSNFEQATAMFKSFTQVKSPTELFQLQGDYIRSAFDQFVTGASKSSEQMLKLAGEVAQPLSNRYAVAAEKVKSAAL